MAQTTWTETAGGKWTSDARTYGVDEKGRTVSGHASITRRSTTYVEGSEISKEWLAGLPQTDGFTYELRIFANRNGKAFGASPPSSRFATLEEAQAAAEPKLRAQAKRYTKKFAPKAAPAPAPAQNVGAVVEAPHYREEVDALKADPIVAAMARELGAVELEKVAHEDGSPRFDFMCAANQQYSKRGGKGAKSIGGVAKAVLALAFP